MGVLRLPGSALIGPDDDEYLFVEDLSRHAAATDWAEQPQDEGEGAMNEKWFSRILPPPVSGLGSLIYSMGGSSQQPPFPSGCQVRGTPFSSIYNQQTVSHPAVFENMPLAASMPANALGQNVVAPLALPHCYQQLPPSNTVVPIAVGKLPQNIHPEP